MVEVSLIVVENSSFSVFGGSKGRIVEKHADPVIYTACAERKTAWRRKGEMPVGEGMPLYVLGVVSGGSRGQIIIIHSEN